jgi:hypothetical protein
LKKTGIKYALFCLIATGPNNKWFQPKVEQLQIAAPATPIEDIRSKNTDQFRRSITAFEIVDVPVVADGSLCIYELRIRPPAAPVARER